MMHSRALLPVLLLAAVPAAEAQTFRAAPLLESRGVDAVTRTVARDTVDRDLLGSPWATVVVGHVDVYDRFPYLESRWFQIVSDPGWDRLLLGELDGALAAHDGRSDALGALDDPRGLTTDERGRLWVADTGNHRVVAYDAITEFGQIRLVPAYAIEDLHRPWDVAYSDGGTPWHRADDRLYVADTGANRVVAYGLESDSPRFAASLGELGGGRGAFAGPSAITVGRRAGVHTADVYVADAHGGHLVHLVDSGERFDWIDQTPPGGDLVTSLDTDHWGAVYAASPRSGVVTKRTAELETLAVLDHGVDRPRAFHVPFVTRTDHRDGSVARVGRGAGLVVEEWSDTSGLRLVKLGVEVRDLSVRADADPVAEFVLTDRATVTGEILDAATGRVVARADLGELDAGHRSVALDAATLSGPLPGGDLTLRITSRSTYDDAPPALAEAGFTGNGVDTGLPAFATLTGSSPNPFRGATTVEFAIPTGGDRSWTLTVHDVTGRRVAELGSGRITPGRHAVTWDGRDGGGREVAAGVYFYRLDVDGEVTTRKAVHLR
jgi:hypothetical protein